MSRSRNFSLPALNDSHFYATDTIAAVFDSPLKTTVQLCRYFVRTNNLGSYLRHSSSIPAHADKNTQVRASRELSYNGTKSAGK